MYLLGNFVDWSQLASLSAVITGLFGILTVIIPKTPTFLVIEGKVQEAKKVLRNLRG